jgi:Spy/CpxP family protein refolding chaperone
MSKQKKMIIGTAILTLAVVVGIGATTVCGPKGSWARGFGPGFHGVGCPPGPHGEDLADFILWKMDRHVKALNLNDAQKKEYEKSKEEIRAGIAGAIERKKDFQRIVHEEMDKENPDINALAGLMKERAQHIPDMVSKPVDLFVNFYNLLDENQKAKVVEMFQTRMGSAHGAPR